MTMPALANNLWLQMAVLAVVGVAYREAAGRERRSSHLSHQERRRDVRADGRRGRVVDGLNRRTPHRRMLREAGTAALMDQRTH